MKAQVLTSIYNCIGDKCRFVVCGRYFIKCKLYGNKIVCKNGYIAIWVSDKEDLTNCKNLYKEMDLYTMFTTVEKIRTIGEFEQYCNELISK